MKNQPDKPQENIPDMAVRRLSSTLRQWLSAEPTAPLRLIFDDEYLYPWPSLEPVSASMGLAEALAEIADAHSACDGLEVHYQGRAFLFLYLKNTEKSAAGHIASRLPPGTGIQDYQTAFCGQGVGLMPRALLEPIFRFAAQRNLLTCRVFAFSRETEPAVRPRLRACSWLLQGNGGEVRRLVPLPPEASRALPIFGEMPPERDDRGALFAQPLFTWTDPREKERRSRRLNRGILAAASILCLLVLGILGGCLWMGNRYYERRLISLSMASQNHKSERNRYLALMEQLTGTLARIETCRQSPRALPLHAVRIRKILNGCPTGMRVERLEYRHGLEGERSFHLDGFALDPGQASQFLATLEELFSGWEVLMEALHEVDEKDISQKHEALGPLRYRFKIKLETVV